MSDILIAQEVGTVVVIETAPAEIVEVVAVGPQGPVGDVNPQMPVILAATEAARDAALVSKLAAAASQSAAATSAANAATSESNAATSAATATAQATASADSAGASAASAAASQASAANAAASESNAAASATASANSATSSANSATAAQAARTDTESARDTTLATVGTMVLKANNLSDLASIPTALVNLGLNNVSNTSDANKPVSTAQQSALDLKLNTSGGTITANSSSAALTITQTGTGNAFVVEDSASPDTTPFVIDQNGQVYVACSSAAVVAAPEALSISSNGVTVAQNLLGLAYRAENAFGPTQEFYKARGTNSAPTIAANGDQLGVIRSWGYDGSTYKIGSSIEAYVDGTTGINNMPGRLVFSTTPSGSAMPVERMRIDASGNVGIGTAPAADSPLHIFSNAGGIKRVVLHNAATTANTAARYDLATGTPNAYSILAQTEDGAGNVSLQLATGVGVNQGIRLAPSVGNVTVNTVAVLGYGTGAGGTVTQATSKSTAVTLNKPCGHITTHNAALAAGASVSFDVNTNKLTAGDGVFVTPVYGPPGWDNYTLRVLHYGLGSFRLVITNISGLSQSDALILSFQIIKGATA